MRLPSFFKDSKSNQCDLANQEKILIHEMKYYELQQVRERRETTPKYKAAISQAAKRENYLRMSQ